MNDARSTYKGGTKEQRQKEGFFAQGTVYNKTVWEVTTVSNGLILAWLTHPHVTHTKKTESYPAVQHPKRYFYWIIHRCILLCLEDDSRIPTTPNGRFKLENLWVWVTFSFNPFLHPVKPNFGPLLWIGVVENGGICMIIGRRLLLQENSIGFSARVEREAKDIGGK